LFYFFTKSTFFFYCAAKRHPIWQGKSSQNHLKLPLTRPNDKIWYGTLPSLLEDDHGYCFSVLQTTRSHFFWHQRKTGTAYGLCRFIELANQDRL
tara:strand:+ start:1756 stop:2040 length:285 start_codon:yes stop_codon:yes gene_type:complete